MSKYRLGANAKLYYSETLATSLTYTLPETVAGAVRNVKTGRKRDTPDNTTRESGGQKQYAAGEMELSISFEVRVPAVGETIDAYDAFNDADINGDEIAVYALTGDKTVAGSEGPCGNFIVESFDLPQDNGSPMYATVTLKPSSYNKWHKVSGS